MTLDLFVDAPVLRGKLETIQRTRQFIEAGHAIITVVSKTTSSRYTFRFNRPGVEDPGRYEFYEQRPIWVSLLSGPDNLSDYSFMGSVFPGRCLWEIRPSAKSRVKTDAPSWMALAWFLRKLYGKDPDKLFEQAEVWHEGRCGRCGRRLTVPESIASGFGPDCVEKVSR